jgi:hypothetical protein
MAYFKKPLFKRKRITHVDIQKNLYFRGKKLTHEVIPYQTILILSHFAVDPGINGGFSGSRMTVSRTRKPAK